MAPIMQWLVVQRDSAGKVVHSYNAFQASEELGTTSYKSLNSTTAYWERKMLEAAKKKDVILLYHAVQSWCLFANGNTPQELEEEIRALPIFMDIVIHPLHQAIYQGAGDKERLKQLWGLLPEKLDE